MVAFFLVYYSTSFNRGKLLGMRMSYLRSTAKVANLTEIFEVTMDLLDA